MEKQIKKKNLILNQKKNEIFINNKKKIETKVLNQKKIEAKVPNQKKNLFLKKYNILQNSNSLEKKALSLYLYQKHRPFIKYSYAKDMM